MPEEVEALGRRERIESFGSGGGQSGQIAGRRLAQMSLEFGEGHLDGVEIRAVRREVVEVRAAGRDRLRHAADLVRGKIVANHQIIGVQLRAEHPFDVNQEECTIHRTIDQPGSANAIMA